MTRPSLLALSFLAAAPLSFGDRKLDRKDIVLPAPLPPGSLLVVGFLGAWEDWNNPKRSVRKLALDLEAMRLPGVFVQTADNHSRGTIRKYVREAADRDRNGRVDAREARQVQLILYGQSFGGAACVYLARELRKEGLTVRLTVQVDSVGKKDDVIPPNVRRAVNFFQRDPGPIQGRAEIRAEDPARTTILGNFQHFYLFRQVDMDDYPWIARKMGLSHWKMDNDPLVWNEVKGLVVGEILLWRTESKAAAQP